MTSNLNPFRSSSRSKHDTKETDGTKTESINTENVYTHGENVSISAASDYAHSENVYTSTASVYTLSDSETLAGEGVPRRGFWASRVR